MNMIDILYKKRDGGALSKGEIDYFIQGYTLGEIPDYQASALLMAIFFQGINEEETYFFTDSMMRSGEVMDLSNIPGIKVDKHSTGGVGDKTTLVVAPICAACGVPVAKMSGRGLGFTGGTIDKLEAIPGFQTVIEQHRFKKIVKTVGMAVMGQSTHVATADKKLYALRDVTATVDNQGMITASIMSKKLAAGSDAIVLDVKCGEGAFMKTQAEAESLGRAMVNIGAAAGKKMAAFVTDMQQPLGFAVGNALEVIEAIDTVKGKGPSDITALAISLAGYMIFIGGKASSHQEGTEMASACMENGKALAKMKQFIEAQEGNAAVTEDYGLFPQPMHQLEIKADKSGFVTSLHAQIIGNASQISGAGRAKKDDPIDLSAGIVLNKKIGDPVSKGDCIAVVYGNDKEKLSQAGRRIETAFLISNELTLPPQLIKTIIT